jgi:hypothetical protein
MSYIDFNPEASTGAYKRWNFSSNPAGNGLDTIHWDLSPLMDTGIRKESDLLFGKNA